MVSQVEGWATVVLQVEGWVTVVSQVEGWATAVAVVCIYYTVEHLYKGHSFNEDTV